MKLLSKFKSHGGWQYRCSHHSTRNGCEMTFSIYLPPQAEKGPVPVLYWLSGLTCTDENFVTKAGAQRVAAQLGLAVVAPDTSPRGEKVPDDPEEAYDLGKGAGFYVNAKEEPWSQNYNMYDYVVTELPQTIESNFPVSERKSISGHSMGGHGALVTYLRNPEKYQSVSAFAPITHPSACPWGIKAFTHYLGNDRNKWKEYDACELVRSIARPFGARPIFVSQGTDDEFLESQLKPEMLKKACDDIGYPLTLKLEPGYDHSYFFINSFIEEHMVFHSEVLNAG